MALSMFYSSVGEEDVRQIKEGKTSWNRCRTPAKEEGEETGGLVRFNQTKLQNQIDPGLNPALN